ncbi:Serine phosphatase RsbU, regulator of sigma subunit [Actinacidiphila rubida]|uniref:protein-serine/threonine phosphatase n=1 Tax=Actinacidiphila rubida TaxID=310780 RepID=A0A1H8KN11_9ACTN|nr:Serine phosphatase RsbU, regulator of sigma subunit [Actinacidiphila rubida]
MEQALSRQSEIGVLVLDAELRVRRAMLDAEQFQDLVADPGVRFPDLVASEDSEDIAENLRHVLENGRPMLFRTQRIRDTTTVVSLFALRLEGDGDGSLFLCLVDVTANSYARERLDLLFRAAESIGESLDVLTTARQIADVFVPAAADYASVSLADELFSGGEPPTRDAEKVRLRRAAVASAGMAAGPPYVQPGEKVPPIPAMPDRERYRAGEVLVVPDRPAMLDVVSGDVDLLSRLAPSGGRSLLAVTLTARGAILGSLEIWRGEGAPPFDDNDARVLREIASRGALSIDNARRFTRESTEALRLQQSLLPSLSQGTSVRTAARYLAASASGGVGGDWYDVVPLSSTRTGLVVGDVVGHGVRAAAMMGRMRTAVQTLADLDLAPDELLTHLDDLVMRLALENDNAALGSTCLFAVYDPVARSCAMASAGHPPPVLVRPDGRAELVPMSVGPLLGVGGLPFEVTQIVLEPRSTLAFYTDGLVEPSAADLYAGMERLREELSGLGEHDDLEEAADRVVEVLAPSGEDGETNLRDDATVMLARVRATSPDDTQAWEFPAREAAVAEAREKANATLERWQAPMETAITTELVVSELVTNAVRYGGGEVLGLRLIRDGRTLVCEVSDASSTSPHLKRARTEDEGGRGLFIVASVSTRWGVRFTATGKTIWTEIRS